MAVDILIFLVASVVLAMLPTIVILILFGDNLRLAITGLFRKPRYDDDPIDALLPFDADTPAVRLPIEQIAADLRRLGRARRLAVRGSVRHHAVTTVYDRRLIQACGSLDIDHVLDRSEGLDHELERLRVECALIQSGLVLAPADTELDV